MLLTINCSKAFKDYCSTQLLSLYLDRPLDDIGTGQDTLIYKIMSSGRFCSQVNLKPAFEVSDLQVPTHQEICFGFWELRPRPHFISM